MNTIKFGYQLMKLHLHNKKLPLCLTLSTTYQCNSTCLHCQAENRSPKEELDTKEWLRLLEEFRAAGTIKVGFTGGEPLMRPDIKELLASCYNHNFVTTLVSNGRLVPDYLSHLEKLNLLYLSLDGDQEVHDSIRGGERNA